MERAKRQDLIRHEEDHRQRPRPAKKPQIKPKSRAAQTIHILSVDYTLFISVLLLVLIGIVMVFSASYYNAVARGADGGRFHYFTSQGINAGIGFVAMFFAANINYRYTKPFVWPVYVFSLVLLVLVLFIGVEVNGARRWLLIPGINFQFQPSEVAKLTVIMMIAKVVSSKQNSKILNTLRGTLFVSLIAVAPILIIGDQNLSTVIVLVLIGFGMIFVASPYTAVFVALGMAGVGALTSFFLFFAEGFRGNRIAAWLDPFAYARGTGFQTVQSLYAIGSGGLFGLGLGQSRQKLGFIPEAHNDIIFSVIIEELGLVGGGLILFLFGVFLWRAIKIAITAGDLYGSLIATGIAVMVGSLTIINVGVVTNTIPNTGVPLPFISFGGTSLIITLASVGLLLSISRYKKDID